MRPETGRMTVDSSFEADSAARNNGAGQMERN